MGKVITPAAIPTTTTPPEVKSLKKKGRPPKNSLTTPHSYKSPTQNSSSRRSTRRNPNHSDSPTEFDEDDDDERKEKKVKLVVRLPQSDDDEKIEEKNNHLQNKRHSEELYSGSGSGSDPESEYRNEYSKKRKVNSVGSGSGDCDMDQDKEVEKATDTPKHGSPLDRVSSTALPEEKFLVFILDRLQKKDTYGVFSEPVDPEELPDYFDIIKQPMDFGTVRKKLDSGIYKNLEALEADVYLICSNAMQYNAVDTIYYRQARSIHELAKRDFGNLRHEGEDGAPQPKIVRRGRPPNSKNIKKPVQTSYADRLTPELSSGATLASDGKATAANISLIGIPKTESMINGSDYHNLRRTSSRFRPTDMLVSSSQPRFGDSECSTSWNTEFPASILRADMKYGSKQYAMDENRRDTYNNYSSPADSFRTSLNSIIDMRQLVPVGLHESLGYARSLARYTEILGPIAWRMASKKIEAVLPPGMQYGPGWVGESRPSQGLSSSSGIQKSSDTVAGDSCSTKPVTSSSLITSTESAKALENRISAPYQHAHYRNGFTRSFMQSQGLEATVPRDSNCQDHVQHTDSAPIKPGNSDEYRERNEVLQESEKLPHQQTSLLQQHLSESGRVSSGSPPHSSIQIDSTKKPDLALQL